MTPSEYHDAVKADFDQHFPGDAFFSLDVIRTSIVGGSPELLAAQEQAVTVLSGPNDKMLRVAAVKAILALG